MPITKNPQERLTSTLGDVVTRIEHWRNNKSEYTGHGIPDAIWIKIFELDKSGSYTARQLKRILTLNSQQYNAKKAQLLKPKAATGKRPKPRVNKAADTPHKKIPPEAEFCEAVVAPIPALTPVQTLKTASTKAAIKQLKSTQKKPEEYLSTSTIVVEYIRPDGHRLKIHTTDQSIHHVMHSFSSGAGAPE